MEQSLMEKLTILADSAKYDVACTSSGASHTAKAGSLGSCYAPGCCHAFTADGRCVSLLKVLMTNCCSFDCGYCVNRRSNDIPRATFAPRELAELTMEFYRRNYIEGLFLSSAVLGTPDYTTERMLAVLRLLRGEYRFGGYIHAKAIPGTSPELLQQLGYLADRLSVNVELPSERSLNLLAPDKGRHSIFRPMKQIAVSGAASREELTLYRHAPKFAPAGQSTQMIVGASPETDYHILKLTEAVACECEKTGVDVEVCTLGTTLTPTAMKNFPKGPVGEQVVKLALTPDEVADEAFEKLGHEFSIITGERNKKSVHDWKANHTEDEYIRYMGSFYADQD